MMSAAVPGASAARASHSAAMIFARLSRSASACLAMTRFMFSGSWPTTLRRVLWAIWLITAPTFSNTWLT
jgi:hypothetical protein